MKSQSFIIIFVALAQSAFAHANNDDTRLQHFLSLSLEELVSLETTIATNSKRTASDAPAVVTLITAEDIKATGATNLTDILESVPGIHVRYSHFAFRPLIHFRGANASQTLLMVNGSPMKDLMWGFGIFWKGLPSSMIERVEIIRGPGSALFGADASAGVINVITKTAGKIEHSEAGLRTGSFNSQTAWMQHGDNWNGYDIALTAELSRTDGHDPFISSDAQTAQDVTYATDVSYAPDVAHYGWHNRDLRLSIAKNNWRLQADYMASSDLEIGLTGAGVLDPVTRAEDERYNVDLFYNNARFSENWELDAELRYQHLAYSSGNGFQERPPGYTDAGGVYPDGVLNLMRSAERRINFETSGLYTGIKDHALRIGVGHSYQNLYWVEQFINRDLAGNPLPTLVNVSDTPYAFAPEKARHINYLFLQDVWTLNEALELTAGARYDHYSDFGSSINPRLALVWKTSARLTTKLMYGQAFRAPSYQELYAITSYAQGNTALDPERSQTLDLALSYSATRDLALDLNLFHFSQSDVIRATGTPRQFQNTGDHTIRGVELEARWQAAENIRLSGNYTIRNQDDNEYRALDQPNQDAYLRLDWGFLPNYNWNLQTSWVGERSRAATDTRPAVDDYFMTDSTLRYARSENWEFAASVRNLFDVDAREFTGSAIADDLPLPERNFYAEMRYKF